MTIDPNKSVYYASHVQPLVAALDVMADVVYYRSDKPMVVECGVGFYSTPLLYGTCATHLCTYRGYESDAECAAMLRAVIGDEAGMIETIDWQTFQLPGDTFLCFIDGTAESRRIVLEQALDVAGLIVVHDADEYDDHFYNLRELYTQPGQVAHRIEVKPKPYEPGRTMPSTAIIIPRESGYRDTMRGRLLAWAALWEGNGLIVGGAYE